MSIIKKQSELHEDMVTWRHHIHKHPELSFKEDLTSDYIAAVLEANGIEMHRGLAVTGIVATIHGKKEGRVIGLRADMDALPIQEKNDFSHKSVHDGKMHACGHDGHSTMLLGAAVHLKENNNFSGTVHFIFQPAEEGGGGGRVMVEEGIFEKFPCEAVYGMHNWPGMAEGQFAVHDTAVMAANETLKISIKGKGGHAAMPDQCVDPVVIGAQIITALQSVVSRNVAPLDSAVVSITMLDAGFVSNVIPNDMNLTGSLRYFSTDVGNEVKAKIKKIVEGISHSMGATATFSSTPNYPATVNTPKHAELCANAAAEVVGSGNVLRNEKPSMGSEDFSFLLNASEGAYIWIGNGLVPEDGPEGGCMLHNTEYDFNDEILPLGSSYWVQLVQGILK
ncbi:M20 aminoacylase family protein [Candidatus Pseudothioglobus sp. Uisw_041]|jgi:amidohydrolase|uniref:M20 aminoacylase family protein n=1 Tax=Candidatus Pseudothioglobus sp. Uisw_041 TaxID=3230996 RepID=UPI0023035E4B|nr:M20 aminoacylase family protein [Candidatus Thioglobus sp.]MDA9060688.1 M20 family metallopeptidase [Candidatus Thioglobus sp.]MDB4027161.1 M20 family metallopeptidase [Candidatus Thioglobus sp.]MDB9864298.1 M20 family metallopeptidase [Candidatus Thioglobus sp.]MDC0483555.1 M20 family metallopeptidase [Candidatus Thioglobus sp.]MDC1450691.1 M20 family metallopeptidase [Candidatus Thioglobus sp.]